MKIEVLYIPDCPHHAAAVQQVHEALATLSARAEIHEIAVLDHLHAVRLAFPGSPTIRVNNRDVAPIPFPEKNPGLQCRLYANAENPGVPDQESVVRALRAAIEEQTF